MGRLFELSVKLFIKKDGLSTGNCEYICEYICECAKVGKFIFVCENVIEGKKLELKYLVTLHLANKCSYANVKQSDNERKLSCCSSEIRIL